MLQTQNDELTVVSFSGQTPPPPERRSAPRNLSVLRTAVLHTCRGGELCLVRNISTGGLMAQIFCELLIDDPVDVEFKSEQLVRGRVIWRRDGLIGIQFGQPVDLSAVLSNQFQCTFLPLEPRAPRVDVNIPARLKSAEAWQSVNLRNISQGGAQLELDEPVVPASPALLEAPGLSVLSGTVRWRDNNRAGIALDKPIPFPDVARWVAGSHRALSFQG